MSDNNSPLLQKPDYLVCTCFGVMHSDLVDAIKAGNTTFEQLQETLFVGTGCSSCVEQVYAILDECKER